MSTVYLNGEFKPIEQATVSVLDRGFLFGDGVYEVVPVYGGCLFRIGEHLRRLGDSLAGIRLANPLTRTQWLDLLEELVERNGGGDQSIYLQVTRGAARRDHAFPADTHPTLFAMASPMAESPLANGVAAISAHDVRWELCNIKAITLLPNALLRQQALDAGAQEAILFKDGLLTEGAASNVFVVRAGEVVTPPKSAQLLPGITRDLVVDLLQEAGLPCHERLVRAEELYMADEIWLTSSTREVLPVVTLDGRDVGRGEPGPLWARVRALYQGYKAKLREECRKK